ncbi:gamma-glutamyltransferase family protein [Bradyrhizobium sp. AS23.2]|uniref:gamma-glutamyltransferase family protein n=1 Tax=Bradyrhizobium sp. AS23.2 TaxID=1680155 RepID=UPI001FDA5838|nr:gamma-glutamyltransferase family protein [Bradyrhizobium sp. AS23.2]
MVATSHPLASLAALDALREGGNAIDGAIAAAAVLAVVEPSQTGIGGDCFALLKKPGHAVVAMNGSGWAPRGASATLLAERGIDQIEPGTPEAVTVPGAVRAWSRLANDYGRLEWERLLAPAIMLAERGYAVSPRLARDWSRQIGKLSRHPACREIFLPQGRSPAAGERHVQLALARTLKAIAQEGADCFYEGWIADDIVQTLAQMDGVHAPDDFASWTPAYEQPISRKYRGYELWECRPNGQGVTALQMAMLLDGELRGKYEAMSVQRFHFLAEVARAAYADRDALVADPASTGEIADKLLARDRIQAIASHIDMSKRNDEWALPCPTPEHRDTTYISVVDEDRFAVSLINSIFDDFGSGIVAARSGVLLHNRGCGFSVANDHPNVIRGRKRPLHTIIPALLTRDNETAMSFGVTGGHFQPMGQMLLLSNVLDCGMTIQEAIDFPRIFARGVDLELEHTVSVVVMDGLARLGHTPRWAENPIGTAQAIWLDHDGGGLVGAADSRRDGIALGI